MGEIGSFYCPEELLEIPNRNLRRLILKDIEAKGKSPTFVVGEEIISFPVSHMSIQQFHSYRRTLIKWGIDPVNPPQGIDGHGYSLMLTEVLRHVLSDSSDLIIRQTPASMDFLEPSDARKWGPSSDIYIGQRSGKHITPLLLVDAVVGGNEHDTVIHPQLKIPVVSMSGNKLFRNGKDAVFSFGMSSSPLDFAQSLAQAAGPKILKRLEVR